RFNGALLGHGGTYAASGDHHGNIYVRAGIEADGTVNNATADVWFQGGSTTEDNEGGFNIAQLGHGGHSAAGNHGLVTETITVMSGRDITFQAGDDNYAYTQLGNGGFASRGDHGGDIQIFAERDIRFAASQFPASTPLGSGLR